MSKFPLTIENIGKQPETVAIIVISRPSMSCSTLCGSCRFRVLLCYPRVIATPTDSLERMIERGFASRRELSERVDYLDRQLMQADERERRRRSDFWRPTLFQLISLVLAASSLVVIVNSRAPTPTAITVVDSTRWGFGPVSEELEPGSCHSFSGATARPDAYRCFATHRELDESWVLDPCFGSQTGDDSVIVKCVGGVNEWVLAAQFEPMDERPEILDQYVGRQPQDYTEPWALELEDGRYCQTITGVSTLLAGERVNYGCGQNDESDGVGLGVPNRSNPQWTLLVSDLEGEDWTPVPIKRAWF